MHTSRSVQHNSLISSLLHPQPHHSFYWMTSGNLQQTSKGRDRGERSTAADGDNTHSLSLSPPDHYISSKQLSFYLIVFGATLSGVHTSIFSHLALISPHSRHVDVQVHCVYLDAQCSDSESVFSASKTRKSGLGWRGGGVERWRGGGVERQTFSSKTTG